MFSEFVTNAVKCAMKDKKETVLLDATLHKIFRFRTIAAFERDKSKQEPPAGAQRRDDPPTGAQ
jgi:hypothetical protein